MFANISQARPHFPGRNENPHAARAHPDRACGVRALGSFREEQEEIVYVQGRLPPRESDQGVIGAVFPFRCASLLRGGCEAHSSVAKARGFCGRPGEKINAHAHTNKLNIPMLIDAIT
jgi:hypothetical protein